MSIPFAQIDHIHAAFANQCAPALIHLRYQLCRDNCPTNHRPAPPRHSACRHSVTTGTAQRLQFKLHYCNTVLYCQLRKSEIRRNKMKI
ncbi:hypothetical protein J6590_042720 [Homalodisca vitripennis]|nr:hypothetical protein J6590_042720 [Homalodisca vitripennis]